MFGESQVETDQFVRTLGWRRVAEKEVSLLSVQTQDALQAFADGVNAYLADRARRGEPRVRGPRDQGARVPHRAMDAGGLGVVAEGDGLGPSCEPRGRDGACLAHSQILGRVSDLYPPYPFDKHQPIVSGGAVVDGQWRPEAVPSDSDSIGTTRPTPQGGDGANQGANPLLPELFDKARSGVEKLDAWLGAFGPGVGSNSSP